MQKRKEYVFYDSDLSNVELDELIYISCNLFVCDQFI